MSQAALNIRICFSVKPTGEDFHWKDRKLGKYLMWPLVLYCITYRTPGIWDQTLQFQWPLATEMGLYVGIINPELD